MLTYRQINARLKDMNLAAVARVIGCSRSALSGYLLKKFNLGEELKAKLSRYLEGRGK